MKKNTSLSLFHTYVSPQLCWNTHCSAFYCANWCSNLCESVSAWQFISVALRQETDFFKGSSRKTKARFALSLFCHHRRRQIMQAIEHKCRCSSYGLKKKNVRLHALLCKCCSAISSLAHVFVILLLIIGVIYCLL